jgi:nucleotide-binding universal stress UspA family protein
MQGDVVVALDGRPASECVLAVAIRLARTIGTSLRLVRVFDVPHEVISARAGMVGVMDETRALAEAMHAALETAAEQARAAGVTAEPMVLQGEDVAPALLREINRAPCRAVVMATHSHGKLRRALLGSVAQRVAREVDVPVVLVPAACTVTSPQGTIGRVLLPIDGTAASAAAADLFLEDPPAGLEVVVLRVIGPAVRSATPRGTPIAPIVTPEAVVERLTGRGIKARTMTCDSPLVPEGILEAAGDSGADLIAMATHVRSGLARLAQGSVTDTVLRSATLPVLVVKMRGG